MKYVGVDIGGTNLKAGLVNDEGSILAMEKRKIAEVSDQKALVEALVALTQSLTERGGLTPEQIRSVGVGVPGAVEIHSGAVLYTCNLPLRNVPLRKLFHRYLPYPLYVENDANCAALAEYYVGAGRDSKRFVTITLGTGVGAGIIHNGKVGEVYNVGGHNEMKNIDIVKLICKELGKPESLITYVTDRKGHDMRYAIDPTKIHNELGWLPETKFADGIKKTIQWYLENQKWWKNIISGEYQDYYKKMYSNR